MSAQVRFQVLFRMRRITRRGFAALCAASTVILCTCAGSPSASLACIAPSRGAAASLRVSSISGPSQIRRWGDRSADPLRVWIEPRSGQAPLGADSATHSMVEHAFAVWQPSGIPVRVAFTNERSDADIAVTFIDHFRNMNDGYTVVTWDCRGSLTRGLIQLAVRKPNGQTLGDSMRLSIATHEAGHALGLGHSRDTADVMSPLVHVTHPSAADIAMLRLMYLGEREQRPATAIAVIAGR